MTMRNQKIKDAILEAALPDVAFDGWTDRVFMCAAEKAGYDPAMYRAVFPAGMRDVLAFFSEWADTRMMTVLEGTNPLSLRVRDRIALAVRTRLEVLQPYKEAERLAIAFWLRPMRKWEGAKLLWKTADTIWHWAGDTATDYNHYTKRTLLGGVIGTTVLFWLNDKSRSGEDTRAFLDRRIENALSFGKIAGKFKTA